MSILPSGEMLQSEVSAQNTMTETHIVVLSDGHLEWCLPHNKYCHGESFALFKYLSLEIFIDKNHTRKWKQFWIL